MATAGTNITALAKPAVGVTAGPTWATDLNTSIDAVDGHDHSTNKGIRITPAAINISADLEFNDNSATELKNIIFSTATAATTSYSIYQYNGDIYWRNGAGTAVQITTGSGVNAGSGSISGMTGNDSGVTYADGSKTFNFFTDSGNGDYGKMAHADLLLFKYSNDNTTDEDYITIAANAAASGASGTIYVPSENGTFLTTATSYAGAINIATSNSNNNIALKPHGTGFVMVGNGGATGKVTSNGAYDLILNTNNGTNSGTITITDSTNGNIDITPHGTGEVNLSKVDIDAGAIDGTAIGASSHTTGKFTTCDATTDFTIGGLVVTDGQIADTGTLALVPVDGCTIALGSDAGDDFNIDSNKLVVEGDTGNVGIGQVPAASSADGQTIKGLDITTNSSNGDFTYLRMINRVENATTTNSVGIEFDHKVSAGSTIPLAGIKASPLSATAGSLKFYTGISSSLSQAMTISSTIVGAVDIETSVSTNFVERGSCFHSTTNRSLVFGY